MDRTAVRSSDIATIGYDQGSQTLEIEFRTGAIYQYSKVPLEAFRALMNAPSHGKYFAAHIRKGPYPYRRIR